MSQSTRPPTTAQHNKARKAQRAVITAAVTVSLALGTGFLAWSIRSANDQASKVHSQSTSPSTPSGNGHPDQAQSAAASAQPVTQPVAQPVAQPAINREESVGAEDPVPSEAPQPDQELPQDPNLVRPTDVPE